MRSDDKHFKYFESATATYIFILSNILIYKCISLINNLIRFIFDKFATTNLRIYDCYHYRHRFVRSDKLLNYFMSNINFI